MTKTEFRALRMDEKKAFLLTKFDDPDGDFEEMSAEDLLNFGIDNWDESWEETSDTDTTPDETGEAVVSDEPSDPDDQDSETPEEAPAEEENPYRLDLGSLPRRPREPAGNTDLG